MTADQHPDQRRLALLAALARNRGELDPSSLARLLRALDPPRPSPAK